ncbi:MAG: heme ABC exporter ATP-binding protein CcmA [Bacillota bacterium]|nr:MAG: heme ABC exporter ATP-binding protein CcmA [Bacillota bacterium]
MRSPSPAAQLAARGRRGGGAGGRLGEPARALVPAGSAAEGASRGGALELRGLARRFGEQVVFRDVSWRVGPGEIGVVMGPNGSGKTTLLRVVAGLLLPDGGEVWVAGRAASPAASAWRHLIGYVGHRPLSHPDLSALENLVFFGRLYGMEAAAARRRAAALLERLGLDAVAHRPAGWLSRGLAQRLEVARCLMHRPILWLWDEPFTGLDAGAARLLEGLLQEHRASGGTAVVVLHDVDRAARLADRVLLLGGGRGRAAAATSVDWSALEGWLEAGGASADVGPEGGSRAGGAAEGPPPCRRARGQADEIGGRAAAAGAEVDEPVAAGDPAAPEAGGRGAARAARRPGGPVPPAGSRADPAPAEGPGPVPGVPWPSVRAAWGAVAALMGRDWRQEWRRREGLLGLATFVLLVGLSLAFALDPNRNRLSPLMGGLLWVAFYFAAVLLFGRSFAQEADRGTLEGLLLAPVDRSLLYLARVASQGAQLLLLELALVPVVLAWLGYQGAPHWAGFVLAMGLGTAGLAAVGTLLGALTASVRGREALLPVLLFPLTAPVLLGAVQAAGAALAGSPEQAALWFRGLAVYDTMFLVAGALLFDYVVAR